MHRLNLGAGQADIVQRSVIRAGQQSGRRPAHLKALDKAGEHGSLHMIGPSYEHCFDI